MKYILFALLVFSLPALAQKQKHSNAYISLMMHETEPGVSLVNSWGIGRFIGLGAGIDVTGYNSEIFVPAYFDLRLKHAFGKSIPFLVLPCG